jgi:cysteinyl-tRNA synthetase
MIRFTDTLTGTKRPFIPITPGKVSMYVCGPTVYNTVHIGNARPPVVFDSLRRFLEMEGFQVTYAQNFTDIDDKIILRMRQESWDFETITHTFIRAFRKDMLCLGVREANFQPRTTHYLEPIIQFIEDLINKDHAYEIEGDVFFDVSSYEEYGALSHRKVEDMIAGSRIEIDNRKKHPADFSLWKAVKPDEPSWPSPWGYGRPAWHIECSTMALGLLGNRFDIHAGGNDLIFPHHENERAQSEALNRGGFANYWLHNGMLQTGGAKMAKSIGNILTIQEAVHRFGRDAIRLFFFSVHYRNPIEFSEEILSGWKTAAQKMKQTLSEWKKQWDPQQVIMKRSSWMNDQIDRFHEALRDDFNTPKAISHIFELSHTDRANPERLKESHYLITEYFSEVLGLFDDRDESIARGSDQLIRSLIHDYIERRSNARKQKDFFEADRIRDYLGSLGIILLDRGDGTTDYQWTG